MDEAEYRASAYAPAASRTSIPEAPELMLDTAPMEDLTLERARQLTLLRNHTVQAAAAAVESARAAIAEARAAMLPTISGSIARTHFTESAEVIIPGIATFALSPRWQTAGSAQLAVSLFSGGRNTEAVKAARASLTTQILDERTVRQQLLFEVTQAWYRNHEAAAQVLVSRDQLKASERQLEDAKNVVKAGRATRDAELTAEVEVLRSRQDLLIAENAVVHARRILNALLARSMDAETTLSDPPPFKPVELESARLTGLARGHQPSLLAFRSGRIALEHQRESLLRSFTPEIVGALGASYTNFRGATGFSTNYTASVSALWTPVDGGRRVGRLQQIHAELVRLREQELQAIQDTELSIERTLLDITEAESAVTLATRSVVAATENYRIISERFRNGKVTTRELLEAQTTLSNSRFALNQARFSHLTLLASLEALVGVAQPDWITYAEDGK